MVTLMSPQLMSLAAGAGFTYSARQVRRSRGTSMTTGRREAFLRWTGHAPREPASAEADPGATDTVSAHPFHGGAGRPW
ncbi:hypothetical protein [Streptomyces sp. NPDC058701]|uniref:hypothetical protein n=1 Tax=Streptomyces sp. NPDC058701 TaxID=3346608 RepID=UPI00365157E7